MLLKLEKLLLTEPLIKVGDRVLCAVSGGADSVALLILLTQLSESLGFSVYAAHLDHSLREESSADARFVEQLCASLNVPLETEIVDIRSMALERNEGVEAAGRFARRRFFERLAKEQGYSSVALAHHADDQAETVLFRLLRGSGFTGLMAMRPRAGLYIRPLLSFKKAELRDWLDVNEIEWREDASNLDHDFSRNRIRHRIMPELRQINRQVGDALCRFSRQIVLEEEFWMEQVETFLTQNLSHDPKETLLMIPIDCLQQTHPALRRRILRRMLEQLRGNLQLIDSCHIDQIEALLDNQKSQSETCLPGAWVARRYDQLQMRLEQADIEPFDLTISEEGRYLLPNGDHLVVAIHSTSDPGSDRVEFCSNQISFPLTVRSVLPGDRFQPIGMVGHKGLKDYFIDNKVTRENRRRALVICAGPTILWLVGERRCEGFLPSPGKPVMQIRLEQLVFVNE